MPVDFYQSCGKAAFPPAHAGELWAYRGAPAYRFCAFLELPSGRILGGTQTEGHEIVYSDDGGDTWNDVTWSADRSCTGCVGFFRSGTGRVFGMDAWFGLYLSDDDGATWAMSGTFHLSNSWINIRSVAQGSITDTLALGDPDGHYGVWYSTDDGTTWVRDETVTIAVAGLAGSTFKFCLVAANGDLYTWTPGALSKLHSIENVGVGTVFRVVAVNRTGSTAFYCLGDSGVSFIHEVNAEGDIQCDSVLQSKKRVDNLAWLSARLFAQQYGGVVLYSADKKAWTQTDVADGAGLGALADGTVLAGRSGGGYYVSRDVLTPDAEAGDVLAGKLFIGADREVCAGTAQEGETE